MRAAILPTGSSKMGLRLLSAALLFVGSALPYSGHDWLSERTGRRSWREQAGAPGWRRARQGRWKALQAPEDGAAAAEGSIGSVPPLHSARVCSSPVWSRLSRGPSFSAFPSASKMYRPKRPR